MAKRITLEQLPAAVSEILEEYGEDVEQNLGEIVRAITKKGTQTLRSQARSAVRGKKYASGWKGQTEVGRLLVEGTIYNAKLPGLPHLLEHGHALRNGGRTAARVHIAPVEAEIIREFEQEVKSKL